MHNGPLPRSARLCLRLTTLALAGALGLPACGGSQAQRDTPNASPPAANAKSEPAPTGPAPGERVVLPGEEPAPTQPASAQPAPTQPTPGDTTAPTDVKQPDTALVLEAKALVDTVAGKMREMMAAVEAAGNDQAEIRRIGLGFTQFMASNKVRGEALNKQLSTAEKVVVDNYARHIMAPLMREFMALMMRQRRASQPANP